MTQAAKLKSGRAIGEWIRDGFAALGILCSSAGAAVQFGVGYGLMTLGAICLGLVILGSVRK